MLVRIDTIFYTTTTQNQGVTDVSYKLVEFNQYFMILLIQKAVNALFCSEFECYRIMHVLDKTKWMFQIY